MVRKHPSECVSLSVVLTGKKWSPNKRTLGRFVGSSKVQDSEGKERKVNKENIELQRKQMQLLMDLRKCTIDE